MAISLSKTRQKAQELAASLFTIYNYVRTMPDEQWKKYRDANSLETELKFTRERLDKLVKELISAETSGAFNNIR